MTEEIQQQIALLNQQTIQLYQQDEYDQAIEIATRALSLAYQHLDKEHPAFTDSLTYLALLYTTKGDYATAETFYRQVLKIQDITVEEEPLDIADSLTRMGLLYTDWDNYTTAELLHKQALEIRCTALGEEHQDFADSLTHLALLHTSKGDYATAQALYQQAQRIYRTVLGENHPYLATCLNNQAEVYKKMGNYSEAVQCVEQALEIERATSQENDLEVAISLNNLAVLYRDLKNYDKAVLCMQQAIEIERSILREDDPDYVTSLNNLAMLYRDLGKYKEAEPLLQQAIEITRITFGKNDPELIPLLYNLVDVKEAMGKYVESEPLLQEVLKIQSQILGEKHPEFANSLNSIAGLYRELGNYKEAERILHRAQQIRRETVGETHLDFAIGLHDLAVLYQQMGNYIEAEQLHQQSLQIVRQTVGENDPIHATGLSSLAVLYRELSHYEKAKQLHQQVLKIEQQTVGDDHPEYATSLMNMAGVYQAMGNYAEAEQAYQQALGILRQLRMNKHPKFANILNNLVSLYENVGNYAEAIQSLQQVLEIRYQTLGEQHPDYAASLHNLAYFYQRAGKSAEAEQLLQKVLKIRRQTLGENHPNYASSLENLALLYDSIGNYAEGEQLYQQALEKTGAALGENHPGYAISLGNLANHYLRVGNYTKAEPLYQQALTTINTTLGENHPDYAITLGNLAELYAATNRHTEAISLNEQVEAINDRMIGQVFSIGSESRRMAYLRKLQTELEAFLSLVCQYLCHSPDAVQAALNLVLRRKGIGAEALAAQRDAVLGGRYPELAPKLEKLTALRMQIAQKTLAGPPNLQGLQEHKQILAQWNAEKEPLEVELARQIPEMNLQQKLQATDWQEVAKALPTGGVLVEFVRSRLYNFQAFPAQSKSRWQPAHYLAFVLLPATPERIQMLDLGEAEPIDLMIATFRASITGQAENRNTEKVLRELIEVANVSSASSLSSALSSAIFEPLRECGLSEAESIEQMMVKMRESNATGAFDRKLTAVEVIQKVNNNIGVALRAAIYDPLLAVFGNCQRLFLAPDGDLTRLPFEVLPLDHTQRLIDEYCISYLGTGRDLLRFGITFNGHPTEPLVIADPDFDLSTEKPPTSCDIPKSFGRQSRDLNGRTLHFKHLPGTRVEGEQISAMLGVQPWLEGTALESQLKACRSPRILHFATHGFFLEDQKHEPKQEHFDPMGRLSGHGLENPLLRSGLALAGANTWLKYKSLPPEAEDGVITAEDVSGLDLLNTELVVLSACETGLGEIHTGEGVFGLRRAFVLAGAKTLVMSLWQVPDRQTQELMTDFYTRVLQGQPCADALREAQLEMKKKYPNPLYWGAFICQGDLNSLRDSKNF
ncbi:tetratricopeptide TPR_2 repeat protein [Kalymmatonema gypsitolerans NIES-4073]|nr:tetratricopeptide TPR_2 repeat protein [Scytonema sp. NIES-4073]